MRRGSLQHLFYCTRDVGKRDFAGEKCFHGYFVGGVEGDAVLSARLGSLISQPQTGKSLEIGLLNAGHPVQIGTGAKAALEIFLMESAVPA